MRLPDLSDLIQDLQLAKEIAIKNEQASQLVTAVMAQAKLLGLDTVVATDDCIDVQPVGEVDYSRLSDDELKQLLQITEKLTD